VDEQGAVFRVDQRQNAVDQVKRQLAVGHHVDVPLGGLSRDLRQWT